MMFRSFVSLLFVSLLAIACTDSQPDLSVLREVTVGCEGFTDFPPVSEVIARDVLTREGDDLFIDSGEYENLERELTSVIGRITNDYPALAEIHAAPDYASGQVLIGMERKLRETVYDMGIESFEPDPVEFITGNKAFDRLNSRLGLLHIEPPLLIDRDNSPSFVQLCFSALLNVPVAANAYQAINEIRYAEPNGYGGDMSDVDAARDGDTWYIVFRDASGDDCPAGCTEEELFRFIVDAGEVLEVSEDEAESSDIFQELTRRVRHRPR